MTAHHLASDRVGWLGLVGTVATAIPAEVWVSILVGGVTIAYVGSKLVLLWRHERERQRANRPPPHLDA